MLAHVDADVGSRRCQSSPSTSPAIAPDCPSIYALDSYGGCRSAPSLPSMGDRMEAAGGIRGSSVGIARDRGCSSQRPVHLYVLPPGLAGGHLYAEARPVALA